MTAGRVALVLMMGVAVAWWGALAWDASQGRASWLPSLFSLAVLMAWATTMWRWARALKVQPALRVYWLPPGMREDERMPHSSTHWRDDQARPLGVHVAMDFGAGLLLRLQASSLAPGRKGVLQWRWVGAQTLHGPWRQRLMTSARRSSLPADEKSIQPLVASLALPGSQKATLPKSARRSA